MARPLGNDLELGRFANRKESLTLSKEARATHLYVCGASGKGKSKFLENLLRQDIKQWPKSKCGMLLIDPHGNLYDDLMSWMAYYKIARPIIPIDLRQDDWIVSYNMLRQRPHASQSVIVDNILQAMAYVWGQSNTDETPLFARVMGNTLHALYEKHHTLADALHYLDPSATALREALIETLKDEFTRRDMKAANQQKPKDFEDYVSSTLNRLQRFLHNNSLRCMIGQPDVSLDLGRALEEGWIILVNLSREKAKISKEDADLFATILLNDLWLAATERGKRKGVKPFYLYLDEFQKFVSPTIAENLNEARGFGLHLTLAHQFPNQLLNEGEHGKKLYDSVMENAENKVVFHLASETSRLPLAKILFQGTMDPDEVKLKLYSTKVMEYREEIKTIRSSSTTRGSTSGVHEGVSESYDEDLELGSSSKSSGSSDSISESYSEGESHVPTLVPVLGKELSQVHFRNLEEQLERAMAVLFDQKQRQFVARLAGMNAPASAFTPLVEDKFMKPERIKKYTNQLLKKWDFVKPMAKALEQMEQRRISFSQKLIQETFDEPSSAKRRLKTS